ncbi:MAG: dienelactone hydrolase family protein [bacterium]|nr:dienelactone hydrolase family protein [bacterium]
MKKGLVFGLFTIGAVLSAHSQDWALQRLNDSPRHHEWVALESGGRALHVFVTYPETAEKAHAVIVIHENRGLTDWVRSLADRLAEAGYIAVAPDLLSGKGPGGGKTSDFANDDAARNAIYELDGAQVLDDLDACADYAKSLDACDGTISVAGFCWGGGQSFRFAAHRSDLKLACVFYGTPVESDEEAESIQCPVYGFYGGNDARVNATIPATVERMKSHGKTYQPVTYEGAGHAFMRRGEEPGVTDANKDARDAAWKRWLGLLNDAAR